MSEPKPLHAICLSGIVFVVLLTMKLAEIGAVAPWSWWWITCPLWAPLVVFAAVTVMAMTVVAAVTLVEGLGWILYIVAGWVDHMTDRAGRK